MPYPLLQLVLSVRRHSTDEFFEFLFKRHGSHECSSVLFRCEFYSDFRHRRDRVPASQRRMAAGGAKLGGQHGRLVLHDGHDPVPVFVVVTALSGFGKIKLGADHDEPEFSYLSWAGMLFAAGISITLFFSAFQNP